MQYGSTGTCPSKKRGVAIFENMIFYQVYQFYLEKFCFSSFIHVSSEFMSSTCLVEMTESLVAPTVMLEINRWCQSAKTLTE